MNVTLRLHGTLRKYLSPAKKDNVVTLQMPAGATVADAIERLGIPPAHAKMMVSGKEHLEPTSPLCDGQEVNLFAPLAGGS